MRNRIALLIALALIWPLAPVLAQSPSTQPPPSKGIDLTGTWVVNRAKSDFGPIPPPTIDSSVVTRDGNMYQIDATSDFGGQGRQHNVIKWPTGEGESTTTLPNGATLQTTTKIQNDTITFISKVSVQGQAVALQSGRVSLSADGKTLTRELDIQPLAGPSTESLHFRLVYDKR
jgi:hypothetical protein